MTGEILSIETAQKLAKLERVEKENRQYEKIICDFDKELNRLFNIIKNAYEYVDKELFAEYVQEKDLKNILGAGLNKNNEVDNAKTTSQ